MYDEDIRIEDIDELDEFDLWEFCVKLFDESVECSENGCYTSDDVLNAMCSEIWEEIASEMDCFVDDEYGEWEDW